TSNLKRPNWAEHGNAPLLALLSDPDVLSTLKYCGIQQGRRRLLVGRISGCWRFGWRAERNMSPCLAGSGWLWISGPAFAVFRQVSLTWFFIRDLLGCQTNFSELSLNEPGAGRSDMLQPLPAVDRSRQVTAVLARYVSEANLKVGDRLPAERELM